MTLSEVLLKRSILNNKLKSFDISFEFEQSHNNIDRTIENFVFSDESLSSGWIDVDWALERES